MTSMFDRPMNEDYPGQMIARCLVWRRTGEPVMLREDWDRLSRRQRWRDTLRGRRPPDFRPEHMRPPRRRFLNWD